MLTRLMLINYFFISRGCFEIQEVFVRNIVIMLVLLASLCAFAEASPQKLDLGVRLGANLMYVHTDSEEDIYPSNGGFGAALSFELAYGFTDNFYVHSGIGVDFRSFFGNESGDESAPGCVGECAHETFSENREYFLAWLLEMPVLLQWQFPGVLFVEAGAVFDVMVDSETQGNMGAIRVEEDVSCDFNNSFGVSLVVGAGHKFDFGLSLDFRILYQVTDLVESENVGYFEDETLVPYGSYYRLLKFQLGVGYWF